LQTSAYPRAKDITLTKRLKLVAELRAKGFSFSRVATLLDYSVVTARRDFAAVEDLYKDVDDINEHLANLLQRTQEEIQKLNELEATAWTQHKWASEWVQKFTESGDPKYEKDAETGQDREAWGPRNAHLTMTLAAQLLNISKQRGELLGILNKNFDITVKLEQTIQVQTIIFGMFEDVDPKVARELKTRISAALGATKKPDLMKLVGAQDSTGFASQYEQVLEQA